MAAGEEIERKFLVNTVPANLEGGVEIVQGYLHVDADGNEKRLRRKGGQFFLTIKSGGGLQRREEEAEIDENVFAQLWPATYGRRVEKVRYEIPYEGRTIELDVYAGGLLGLVTAEVEFDSVEEAKSFTPPEFLGGDVTNDGRYKNQRLAVHGIPPTD